MKTYDNENIFTIHLNHPLLTYTQNTQTQIITQRVVQGDELLERKLMQNSNPNASTCLAVMISKDGPPMTFNVLTPSQQKIWEAFLKCETTCMPSYFYLVETDRILKKHYEGNDEKALILDLGRIREILIIDGNHRVYICRKLKNQYPKILNLRIRKFNILNNDNLTIKSLEALAAEKNEISNTSVKLKLLDVYNYIRKNLVLTLEEEEENCFKTFDEKGDNLDFKVCWHTN